jgi:hypothetical protein
VRPITAVVVFALILPVGAPGAPVPKPAVKPVDYFPTKVGDKWVYLVKSESARQETELVETVSEVKVKDGVKVVTISRAWDDNTFGVNREREVSAKGVVQMRDAILDVSFDAPWVHLKLPHKDDQSWDVPHLEQKYTAHGPEEVKVPAGTFHAIRVEHWEKIKGKSVVVQTEWFAPRVGIVKLKAGETLIEMKSFTPGKD